MKKIGIIDHYLDNWHANHLPEWLENETKGAYQICYAYGSLSPVDGEQPEGHERHRSSATWCREMGVELCASPAEVVEKADVLMVLAPNSPEQHVSLSRDALASGKRTYIDKTFAPDVKTAKEIFAMAQDGRTPMFSSSALRFSAELPAVARAGIRTIQSRGGGIYKIYAIHQLEMIVVLLGTEARRVMALGTEDAPQLVVEFSGGRYATWGHFDCDFGMAIGYDGGKELVVSAFTNFFPNFVHELVDFFETGAVKAEKAETLAVIGIREAGFAALANPGTWVEVSV
ncbi:MAG: hypothetical protein VB111_01970 [Clostridiaceae bacterium]|nr:hypothetical protein [Clostridiaceae bacterium]